VQRLAIPDPLDSNLHTESTAEALGGAVSSAVHCTHARIRCTHIQLGQRTAFPAVRLMRHHAHSVPNRIRGLMDSHTGGDVHRIDSGHRGSLHSR
jgi:hypothetical protein